MHLRNTAILILLLLMPAGRLSGQNIATSEPAPNGMASTRGPAGFASRWIDLQAGTLGARFKKTEPSGGPWLTQIQYQVLFRGKFKFDSGGRYYAGYRLGAGRSFTQSWNSTGAADGTLVTNLYLKELFFSASPWKALEIQVGGLGFNRGDSTEITSYSNNGYLTGERISLRLPEKLFFDEISATGAYVGDQYAPDVFGRLHRLSQMNYHQFLIAKAAGKGVSFSIDYTSQDGVDTLRQAVRLALPKNRFADALVFDNYERLQFKPAWGCSFSAQKSPTPRLNLTGGFVNVDQHYINLNSDRLGRGKRIYLIVNYYFWRDFSFGIFAGKAFSTDYVVANAARYDFSISYDVARALKRAHIL